MKSINQLLSSIKPIEVIGSNKKNITDVVSDSRRVTPGSLFVAVRGTTVDGHSFIPLLQYSGVGAIVCEELPELLISSITYIRVENSAVALGYLASEWYDNPSRRLKLVGVTGTNGKTTTATLIYEMARLMGYKAGLLSTVCNYIDDEAVPTAVTTPDPLTINALLSRMVSAGCSYAAMEVSS
ncbi:MAG: UDP-N-acetylmuramoyl-L-alanyl-D-glutamate--2,6-diaminopimelate ligase, partial [Muribaculum sp.]|nr:UDP-N-acetylmuramoyl-L-alanyl-D-glutamate--2,6-diaminopimelate ligase [Muribaculum sp.]